MTVLNADDAQLVARLRHGDAGAARELYERHGSALLRFGMAMSNSRQTAEDVVHDTFVELLKHPSRFVATRGPVIAFLFGIARHRMARIARVTSQSDLHDDEGNPGSNLEADELADDTADTLDRMRNIERVRAAVFDLPRVHREVIALCDLEELPYATVATILACPIGTVRSRLSRGRALLATRLDLPDEPEDEERRALPAADADPASDLASDLGVDDSALSLSVRGSVT